MKPLKQPQNKPFFKEHYHYTIKPFPCLNVSRKIFKENVSHSIKKKVIAF